MTEIREFADGGYRFIRGVLPYSAGVAAVPGMAIERLRLRRVLSMADGFAAIAAHLRRLDRPLTALCACELRSPAQFTDQGFAAFNLRYVDTLTHWKLFRDGVNPVARSNLVPALNPPAEPSFHAFSYTLPAADAAPSFVIAGSGEVPEGRANYRDHIVAKGDVSATGMLRKVRWVLAEQERRLAALGFGWPDVTATQVYTVHDIHPFLASELVARGADAGGITWHYVRPPIVDLDYEMDCRGVALERVA
ncbi:MAG: 2-amino-5-chloromuconate deaminase CnbZ [Telluria sp.]